MSVHEGPGGKVGAVLTEQLDHNHVTLPTRGLLDIPLSGNSTGARPTSPSDLKPRRNQHLLGAEDWLWRYDEALSLYTVLGKRLCAANCLPRYAYFAFSLGDHSIPMTGLPEGLGHRPVVVKE